MIRAMSAALGLLVLLLLVAIAAALLYRGQAIGAHADAETARSLSEGLQAQLEDEKGARAIEQADARAMARIGTQHEEDRQDAQALPARVVADIDSGVLRLRRQWAACETARLSTAAAATVERDALAELRRKDQGDLVRVGRDANDQVRACQGTVRSLTNAAAPPVGTEP